MMMVCMPLINSSKLAKARFCSSQKVNIPQWSTSGSCPAGPLRCVKCEVDKSMGEVRLLGPLSDSLAAWHDMIPLKSLFRSLEHTQILKKEPQQIVQKPLTQRCLFHWTRDDLIPTIDFHQASGQQNLSEADFGFPIPLPFRLKMTALHRHMIAVESLQSHTEQCIRFIESHCCLNVALQFPVRRYIVVQYVFLWWTVPAFSSMWTRSL